MRGRKTTPMFNIIFYAERMRLRFFPSIGLTLTKPLRRFGKLRCTHALAQRPHMYITCSGRPTWGRCVRGAIGQGFFQKLDDPHKKTFSGK